MSLRSPALTPTPHFLSVKAPKDASDPGSALAGPGCQDRDREECHSVMGAAQILGPGGLALNPGSPLRFASLVTFGKLLSSVEIVSSTSEGC